LEHYEEWDVTIPPLPSRSRLYHLEPIGIGTPYVESLTSYIARLAEMHCVTPRNLIVREILPAQSQRVIPTILAYGRFWSGQALTLNSLTPVTKQWVEVLQSFTLCDTLRFLTMLTWSDVIGVLKLVRRNRAWCPACYEEWRQNHHVVYEPLLWALVRVTTCLKHRQPLVSVCPQCHKSLPFLTQITRPGYCTHCGVWLGDAFLLQAMEAPSNEREGLEHQHWVAQVVGELLAGASHLSEPPRKEQIAAMTSLYIEQYAKGNISALARWVKLSRNALWTYNRGTAVPNFDSLLHLCSALSLTPLEFLTAKTLPNQRIPQFVVDNVPVISPGKWRPVSTDDVQRMQSALEGVLAEERDPPPCLIEAAKSIGYSAATLRRHCPDLSKRIVARYRRQWTEEDYHQMKQELENALKSAERVTLSAVAQQFGWDSRGLRKHFPDLCRAVVTHYHERFDYEQVRRRLQDVLTSDEGTPSVDELARQMGYGRNIFRTNFPDLCKQVSERRSAVLRNHHKERMATLCNEIRQAAFHLHRQGTYPSKRQVSKQLSDPQAMRAREAYEAWRLTLEELGYPTDHLKKYI